MLVSGRTPAAYMLASSAASWVSLRTRWMMHYRLPSPASMVSSVRAATSWAECFGWNDDNLFDVDLLRHFPQASILSAARRFCWRRRTSDDASHNAPVHGRANEAWNEAARMGFIYALGEENLCKHKLNSQILQKITELKVNTQSYTKILCSSFKEAIQTFEHIFLFIYLVISSPPNGLEMFLLLT